MEWEKEFRNQMMPMGEEDREKIRQLCLNAYLEGCRSERAIAIEAYRLRCHELFGNKCMRPAESVRDPRRICGGNCLYIKRYEFELYKLEH